MAKRDHEMRDADFVVCVAADQVVEFTDNVFAVCCHCGRPVQHRPYVPREVRKLCVECGAAAIKADPQFELLVTEQQRRDIAAALKRRH